MNGTSRDASSPDPSRLNSGTLVAGGPDSPHPIALFRMSERHMSGHGLTVVLRKYLCNTKSNDWLLSGVGEMSDPV